MRVLFNRIFYLLGLVAVCLILFWCTSLPRLREAGQYIQFKQTPDTVELPVATDLEQCIGAPFALPTSGWIGIVYGDSILGVQNHSGLDVFGLQGNGVTPVYAAYDGYLTRYPEWTSAVIIRHPNDPLQPGRQIWTYYTHMADETGRSYILEQIPPGTVELPVKKGTLLGFQGDYNGNTWRAIDTHLHFSIVLDDGHGKFLNETDLNNTLDPSPYLGMRLNTFCADRPPVCRADVFCPNF
ncbi:MAG TPA: M23 family metallopeptidase [Anaerolineae bacterium]|nr:M23 family metallopeptidase [Anaerolineae bacterium]HMR64816.1 M23 family metallopeptidase [Anaerolineae bacterium]